LAAEEGNTNTGRDPLPWGSWNRPEERKAVAMRFPPERLPIDGLAVWRLGPRRPISIAAYLVAAGEESLLVDTLTRGKAGAILEALRSLEGVPLPRTILLTHCHGDHAGSAAPLAEELDAEVLCGAAERPYVEGAPLWRAGRNAFHRAWLRFCSLGSMMQGPPVRCRAIGEDPLPCGLVGVAIPGHTPGQLAAWHEPTRTLICGDGFFNFRNRLSRDPFPGISIDPRRERESMAVMARLEPENLLPAHGPAIIGGAARRMRRFA
jgi:glyoxylase-like metal-dependent hydrolase (beta-lactamase superfamily II)